MEGCQGLKQKMTTIQLKRSGGQLGKMLTATKDVDMPEEEIVNKLVTAAPQKNALARDEFYYSIVINNRTYPIDRSLLKGGLKKIVDDLENNLKVESK